MTEIIESLDERGRNGARNTMVKVHGHTGEPLHAAHAWGRRRTRGSGVGACAGVEESLGILELAQRGGLAA